MTKIIKIPLSFLCFCLLIPIGRVSGQTVKVITRTIEKSISYKPGQLLKVTGEKSHIEVHGWDKAEVHVKVKLISKHADKKQAEKELEYLHFVTDLQPKVIELSNTFVFPADVKKIEGSLKAEYEIWAPRYCSLHVIDKFGDIVLEDMTGTTALFAQYSNMYLKHCTGQVMIASTFSDLVAEDVTAKLNCKSSHADIRIEAMGGQYQLQTSYGKIDISAKSRIEGLNIDASRCPVNFISNDFEQYNYQLNTTDAAINIADRKYDQHLKSSGHVRSFFLKVAKLNPLIKIATTYEPVTIN
jgi:hypothetical protein